MQPRHVWGEVVTKLAEESSLTPISAIKVRRQLCLPNSVVWIKIALLQDEMQKARHQEASKHKSDKEKSRDITLAGILWRASE